MEVLLKRRDFGLRSWVGRVFRKVFSFLFWVEEVVVWVVLCGSEFVVFGFKWGLLL